GRAFHRLALVRDELGEKDAALKDYERMQAIFAQLAADFPADPAYRHQLAVSHVNLGVLLSDLGQRPAAEQAYRRALDLQEQRAAAGSSSPRASARAGPARPPPPAGAGSPHRRAGAPPTWGFWRAARGKRPAAGKASPRALALQERRAAASPAVPAYRLELAG